MPGKVCLMDAKDDIPASHGEGKVKFQSANEKAQSGRKWHTCHVPPRTEIFSFLPPKCLPGPRKGREGSFECGSENTMSSRQPNVSWSVGEGGRKCLCT